MNIAPIYDLGNTLVKRHNKRKATKNSKVVRHRKIANVNIKR